jgi:hypothetical protein
MSEDKGLMILIGLVVAWSSIAAPRPVADAHVHLLDFLQNGDHLEAGKLVHGKPGMALPTGERGKRLEALLYIMDQAGVSQALVTGMPYSKRWSENDASRPAYYLDSGSHVTTARDTDYVIALAVQDFIKAHPRDADKQLARLFPCVSGFDSTDLGAVDLAAKRIKEFPGIFKCIGEVMSRHDDLTALSESEPRANHPALLRLFDFAGEQQLPVSIHHNIAPISPNTDARTPAYLEEFLELVDASPKTKIIWCHAGVSRRIIVGDLPKIIGDVLTTRKEHLFVDLSWVLFDDYISKNVDAWVTLIEAYPNNFVLGSDIVGNFDTYAITIRRYDTLLSKLAPATADKVATGNFLAIMPKHAATLARDYAYPESRYTHRTPPIKDMPAPAPLPEKR